MKERPILFSGPMVRAILDGRKTQTRRVINPQPLLETDALRDVPGENRWWAAWIDSEEEFGVTYKPLGSDQQHEWACPYGVPGDRLWVRETWALIGALLIDPCLNYRADNSQRPINHHKTHADMWYPAGSNQWIDGETLMKVPDKDGWRPSIFMPRWASRITLEITDVRVQRVQEISEEDARAEGCGAVDYASGRECILDPALGSYRLHFHSLWDSINGKKYPWALNPWVWALTFRRVQ